MKAEIRKEDLKSQKLSWLCIEPMLLSVRGQSVEAKKEVYMRLNEGQQALYLFYSYHNHTISLSEFYWFSAYNIIDLRSWSGIRKGMQFFDLNEMIDVLDEIEALITDVKNPEKHGTKYRQPIWNMTLSCFSRRSVYTQRYRQASQQAIITMNEWVRQRSGFGFRG